ncbi:ankyrin repeat domain-containing protein [Thalassolituus hydrocarboniclasticus]|uniref:Ankyrin repeat protein n=1 Tax=Thalassolituus hydrocarboniclasticus TaxID=2742796 RepID=A0ABY6AGZ6_9GAMM|nr:ankyrin repeat domain-containing protein [Thalassolituus hydrocarboniclasticus]UXD88958.1 hypothetical protein HUF19_16585 [Thalassolituus hydrocarboniclasticus]
MQTPFPTLMELVRLICNAFDAGRPIKKELDNKVTDLYVTLPEAMEYFSRPELKNDFIWILGNSESRLGEFVAIVESGLRSYIDWIKNVDANGMSRDQMTPIIFGDFARRLLEGSYPMVASSYPVSIFDEESGLVSYALPSLLAILRKESLAWQAMLKHITKQQSDMIGSWERGDHIPDLSSLKGLLNHPGMENERSAVMLARAWDYIIRDLNQAGSDPSTWSEISIQNSLFLLRDEVNDGIKDMFPAASLIERYFKKDGVNINDAEAAIHDLRSLIQNSNNPHFSDLYCDRALARMRAQQESFDECLSLYKRAVEKAMYLGCDNIELLLNEAMSAAAAIGPDRVFCKQLRKAQVLFGYAAPFKSENNSSSKFSDHVQGWQIERYAEAFIEKHNSEKLKAPRTASGPIAMLLEDMDNIRYDLRKPDKIISLKTQFGQKRMPQLACAVYFGYWDSFLKLLESGASVDVLTSSEESPLLLAIERMSPDTASERRDIRYFEKLSSIPHKRETMDQITSKKRLSILHSAVNSGNPYIVEKVIDMGCGIDLISTTNKCSPLYHAVRNMDCTLNSGAFLSRLKNPVLDTEGVDAIMRYTNSLANSDSIIRLIHSSQQDSLMASCMEIARQHIVDPYLSIPLESRLKIIDLLIENGASVNLEHSYPIKGYTPLMHAVEVGALEVVEKMLKFGGDPEKTHYQPDLGRHLNCFDLAKLWNRKEIFQLLSSQLVGS